MEYDDVLNLEFEPATAELYGISDVLPVASGGLHPGIVGQLIDALGTDICIQAGGGIHGHPDGTYTGAKALRQATEASMDRTSLEAYAEDHGELATALEKWGRDAAVSRPDTN